MHAATGLLITLSALFVRWPFFVCEVDMTQKQIIALFPLIVMRSVRRWMIRRQLDSIGYHLKHIAAQRENDRHVERILQGRQARLLSDLRQV